MTYYEKYQTLLDEATIKVIKGTIPISFNNEINKSFFFIIQNQEIAPSVAPIGMM